MRRLAQRKLLPPGDIMIHDPSMIKNWFKQYSLTYDNTDAVAGYVTIRGGATSESAERIPRKDKGENLGWRPIIRPLGGSNGTTKNGATVTLSELDRYLKDGNLAGKKHIIIVIAMTLASQALRNGSHRAGRQTEALLDHRKQPQSGCLCVRTQLPVSLPSIGGVNGVIMKNYLKGDKIVGGALYAHWVPENTFLIYGLITDEQNDGLVATAQLKDASGKVLQTSTTNAAGSYLFLGVAPGECTVESSSESFVTQTELVTVKENVSCYFLDRLKDKNHKAPLQRRRQFPPPLSWW